MRPSNNKHHSAFGRFARRAARWTGHSSAFVLALVLILVWLVTGPIFHFSDTWQLVINTSTTIITFLMVFLIQNTQNRDAEAMQVKLDELLRAIKGARTAMADLEELDEEELDELKEKYAQLAEQARRKTRHPKSEACSVNEEDKRTVSGIQARKAEST